MIINDLKKNTRIVLLISCSILIMVLITIPMEPAWSGAPEPRADKFVHGVMFSVFSFLILFYFNNYKNKKFYFISIFSGIAYSFLTEFIQSFLPTRTTSEFDLIAGCMGVILINIYVYTRNFKKT